METEHELNGKILAITTRIRQQHTELSLYLAEMRVTIPDEAHPEINGQNLRAYYDTLKSVLQKYAVEHQADNGVKPT